MDFVIICVVYIHDKGVIRISYLHTKNFNGVPLWVHITGENHARQTFPDREAIIITEVSQLHLHHVHLQKFVGEDPAFSPERKIINIVSTNIKPL